MHDNIINDHIKKYIEKNNKLSLDIFYTLSLFVYQQESKDSDLYILAKLLSDRDLIKLVSYYDGEYLKLPTIKDFRKCLLFSFCLYMREIEGMDWKDIKDILQLPEDLQKEINSISFSKRIKVLKQELQKDLNKILKK